MSHKDDYLDAVLRSDQRGEAVRCYGVPTYRVVAMRLITCRGVSSWGGLRLSAFKRNLESVLFESILFAFLTHIGSEESPGCALEESLR
jgi:hypothetical protein